MGIPKRTAFAVVLIAGTLPLLTPAAADASPTKKVKTKLLEFKIRAKPNSAKAGDVRFKVKNIGGLEHEMVIVRGDSSTLPIAEDGSVDEAELPEDALLGEAEDVDPKKSATLEVDDITPGTYTLFCNLVEVSGDTSLSHYAQGMHTTFTVR